MNRPLNMNIVLLALAGLVIFYPFTAQAFVIEDVDIEPYGSFSETYDDNITNNNDNEIDDFITKVSAGAILSALGKTQSFDVNAGIAQQIFVQESGFNNTAFHVGANYAKEFSWYDRLKVSNRFRKSEEPETFEDAFGVQTGRYSTTRNDFNMNYSRDLSKHFSVEGKYGNHLYNADKDDAQDSLTHKAGLVVNYLRSSTLSFLTGYNYSASHYDPGGDAHVNSLYAGANWQATEQLDFTVTGGTSFVENFNGDQTNSGRIGFAVGYDLSETEALTLSYTKDTVPSTYEVDLFDSWRLSARFNKQIYQRLQMVAAAFYGEGEYKNIRIHDQNFGGSIGLEYELRENMTAAVSYTHRNVDSNQASRTYTKNRADISVRVKF